MLSNLSAQAREYPIPFLLIGAGMALLVRNRMKNDGYQGGLSIYRDDAQGDLIRRTADPTAGFGYDEGDYSPSRRSSGLSGRAEALRSNLSDNFSSAGDRVASQASAVRESVSGSLSSMRDTYSSTTDAVSARAEEWREAASETFSDVQERAGEYTERARSGLATLAHEQPLVLGALGLLAGAALAAMLPRTRIEGEYMGSTAQRIRDEARHTAEDAYERAKLAATRAAETAAEVAKEEFSGKSHDDQDQSAGRDAKNQQGSGRQLGASSGQQKSGQGSSGGPQSSGVSSPGGTSAAGAAALGVSSGSGGARPTESISSASDTTRRS
jgi:hypothetical protein